MHNLMHRLECKYSTVETKVQIIIHVKDHV